MIKQLNVIPARHWVNSKTGVKASIYGACPWTSAADKANWEKVTTGYTWERIDSDGSVTIGLCRTPAATKTEAEEIAAMVLARQADYYNPQS